MATKKYPTTLYFNAEYGENGMAFREIEDAAYEGEVVGVYQLVKMQKYITTTVDVPTKKTTKKGAKK